MKKVGVLANFGKDRARSVLGRIEEMARKLGLELYVEESAECFTGNAIVCPIDQLVEAVDGIIALGGDGTMLRVVRELKGSSKPVIGFNIGSLGFMTSVAENDFDRAMECLAKDDFSTGTRAIARSQLVRDGEKIAEFNALNEIAVERGPSSRVITLGVSINGDDVSSYVCDGLIVSTPTGSTGHSLSAGGPILSPGTNAFVISLICPHTLSSRPLVVDDTSDIRIKVSGSTEVLLLSADGQVNMPLKKDDCVHVTRSDSNAIFITLPGFSYYSVLRQKLNWQGVM